MYKKIIALVVLLGAIGLAVWFYYNPQSAVPRAAGAVVQQAADATTTGKVKSAFALSKRLSVYDIGVDTSEGLVTLTGGVPSEIDKQLAVSVAKDTNGVKQVNDQLVVQEGVQPSEASLRESARVADLEIRAGLQERLAVSPELKDKEIQSSVQDQVVTLTGTVDTPAQKMGAEQVARSIPNVANVLNSLSVNNPAAGQSEVPGVSGAAKDSELARQVSFALFVERGNFTDHGMIKTIGREDGVTLSGIVYSRAERALAERIARDVKGVGRIDNQLTVSVPR